MGKQVGTLKMTGSFAGAVGYIDKQGRVQMRSKAEKVTDANTVKQREVRTRFLAVSTLAAGLKNVLVGLTPQAKAKKITLRNTFVKYNYAATESNVQSDGDIDAITDFTMVRLSMGPVANPTFGTPSTTNPLQIDVAVTNADADPDANADNAYMYLVAYHPSKNKAVYTKQALEDVTISLPVPSSWNGDIVKVYGFVQCFDSATARNEYDSIFNDPSMRGGEAQNTLRQLQSAAQYSESHYIGEAEIS